MNDRIVYIGKLGKKLPGSGGVNLGGYHEGKCGIIRLQGKRKSARKQDGDSMQVEERKSNC